MFSHFEILYCTLLGSSQRNSGTCILLYFLILDFAYSPKGRYGCFFLGDVENFKDFSPDTRCYPEKIFHLTMSWINILCRYYMGEKNVMHVVHIFLINGGMIITWDCKLTLTSWIFKIHVKFLKNRCLKELSYIPIYIYLICL